jgi:hypothetical protein
MTSVASIVVMSGSITDGLRSPAACHWTTATSPTVGVGRNWLVRP